MKFFQFPRIANVFVDYVFSTYRYEISAKVQEINDHSQTCLNALIQRNSRMEQLLTPLLAICTVQEPLSSSKTGFVRIAQRCPSSISNGAFLSDYFFYYSILFCNPVEINDCRLLFAILLTKLLLFRETITSNVDAEYDFCASSFC